MRQKPRKIRAFNLQPGRKVGTPYEVVKQLGSGTEGEVYKILEVDTGISRAAKLYFPDKISRTRGVVWHARKLNKLRSCPIVLQYHHTQMIQISRQSVLCLISDYCDGIQLERFIKEHRGNRLPPYLALHVLYHLVRGLEQVHGLREYHADVHTENILIEPRGVTFDLKLIDFFNWGRPSRDKRQQDILDCVRVFYDCLGGRDNYERQSEDIRYIMAGLKSVLILNRFPTMSALRLHLESFLWNEGP